MSTYRKPAGGAEPASRRDAAELARLRAQLIQRAALERYALREPAAGLQAAGDGVVRAAGVAVGLVRRFWLPLGVLMVAGLFTRLGPALRVARMGLAVWQVARLLRHGRGG